MFTFKTVKLAKKNRKRKMTYKIGGGRRKRQATTPIGGIYKDQRRNIQGDECYEDEEEAEWTEVSYSRPKEIPQQSDPPPKDVSSAQTRTFKKLQQVHSGTEAFTARKCFPRS